MKAKKTFSLLCFSLIMITAIASGREVTDFTDGWTFKKGPFANNIKPDNPQLSDGWEQVEIPHTWNADDMQLNKNDFYTGNAYYKKTYTPDATLENKRIYLRFEGVASVADVYINNEFAGNHKGAYSAFAIEITKLLKYGKENTIIVKADNSARPDVIPVNHKLFGVYGGMYRPVQLIVTDKLNITVLDYASPGVYLRQQNVTPEFADVSVKVKLENRYDESKKIRLINTIHEADGTTIKAKQESDIVVLPQGRQTFEQVFKIEKPHLWQGMADPYIYTVVTRIVDENGIVIDTQTQPLGLRKFELKAADGMYLNGKKVPMFGVCRHQEWLGLGSALKNEHHDTDLAIMKEIGATTIRFAHYQQSEYLYSQCDKIGFIIWAEIPFVNRVTTEERSNARQQMVELIRQNYNHPAIYVWGLHNEVYKPHNYTTDLTMELHDIAKTEDPDRYTVAVNGYGEMKHPVNLNADIQGMNRYYGWYQGEIPQLANWIEELEKNYPNHMAMLAEYGTEANIDQQEEIVGNVGNFFSQFYPEQFASKFHEIQWGIISKHKYLLASYLWNTFDFATPETTQGGVNSRNMKGLVTFDRKIKKDDFYWYKANWSKEPVVYLTQRRLIERFHQNTTVTVYSNVGKPQITVNGEAITDCKQGTTNVHYIFENVALREGDNTIKARAGNHEDEVKWHYDKANEGKNHDKHGKITSKALDQKVSNKDHGGL